MTAHSVTQLSGTILRRYYMAADTNETLIWERMRKTASGGMDVDFGSWTTQLSWMTAHISDTILPSSSPPLPIRLKIFFSARSMLTLVALVQLFSTINWQKVFPMTSKVIFVKSDI